MENDQNDNTQTPTPNLNTQEPGSLALVTKVPKTPKLSNLTKLQKLIFCIMLVLVLVLVGAVTYLLISKSKIDQQVATKPAADIQKMNCDEAKTTLSSVNNDPNLIQVYNNVTVISVKGNEIGFKTDSTTYHYFNLTTNTKIEKIGVNSVTAGSKDNLKVGIKLVAIQANPLNEIVYVGYEL